jgi:hypothetical protein
LCPKEKGIQSQNHFQLRGKTWTALGPNNNRYIMVHVRKNKRWKKYY